jgi:hypothetical protein
MSSNLAHISINCATNRYFQVLGKIHDIESFSHVSNVLSLSQHIFLCHWGHLGIIFVWVSGTLSSIGQAGNYMLWTRNPIAHVPVAHVVWDPHFSANSYDFNNSYSSVYHQLYSMGLRSVGQIIIQGRVPFSTISCILVILAYKPILNLVYTNSLFLISASIANHFYFGYWQHTSKFSTKSTFTQHTNPFVI